MVISREAQSGEFLVQRIREGDRHAAADYGMSMAPIIRRRIRGKLGPRMRTLFDSLDIVSTVLRRLDLYVVAGQIRATTEDELRALIMTITQHALLDKARMYERLRAAEGEDRNLARLMLDRTRDGENLDDAALDVTLEQAVSSLSNETDQTILWLWLTGIDHGLTAQIVGISLEHVRKRWERIRSRLRRTLGRAAA